MELPVRISREVGKGHLITAWLCSELTCITGTRGVCSSLKHILAPGARQGDAPREGQSVVAQISGAPAETWLQKQLQAGRVRSKGGASPLASSEVWLRGSWHGEEGVCAGAAAGGEGRRSERGEAAWPWQVH